MFLFIFESIGTSELILIGIIALIFLGPRKLPQIAKTIGKTIADFRTTTNEFKSTWEREVNFEDEEMALRTGELTEKRVARVDTVSSVDNTRVVAPPDIKQIDKEMFDGFAKERRENPAPMVKEEVLPEEADSLSDKRNWL